MKKYFYIHYFLLVGLTLPALAQDVSLFQQFNGRYDYTAIGNTMNTVENGTLGPCTILTSSSANLSLNSGQNIVAAYLYWAGTHTGDFNISLNNIDITAERTFSDAIDSDRVFFAAFADVTSIILNQGNTDYTISNFDLNAVIAPYCPSGTNFGGWAITVIYEDSNLPLNQLNVYDGLQSVPDNLSISLDNLNVLDNENAKIGFVAWEGDRSIAVNEQLTINGNVISNYPLNPANNAFNGTNSFTGATNLYNMDIDVYNIQDNINIGDTSATIALTSGQDFVMINNIITVLNSQLPDATITIDNDTVSCGDTTIEVFYTVHNTNSTDVLPANTPIAFYSNGDFIGASVTLNAIAINASESNSIYLNLPEDIDPNVTIIAIVDDDGTMTGVVTESNENNNSDYSEIELLIIPEIIVLPNLIGCNEGLEISSYNLFEALKTLDYEEDDVAFYLSLEDLETASNSILIPSDYNNASNPETIYVSIVSDPCYEIFQFDLTIENCPPYIPQGFSPNNDTKNDWFNIQDLYDIFTEHELQIYNRYGDLIFVGNNEKPWYGKINRGLNNIGGLAPVGTYYYILNLNDPNYKPFVGWVYVNY
ncbi:T9SS type B sorting domain-containing protein [Winogradskyella thalassocola]|uniref:Gliding motility-associated C-terminal domain-containing protein n=1 Tax=Winogradskyella thalassocola TaxID=262004 RepID=A0A1G8EWG8_9FLAO|nr:gliding motility-associated C-terminal domain-containing protein [Winogradskyella thalassocola]SDH74059.1 gliding motility-associated C-terminal domain-containing protein [Winogradskyella thalassocola]